MDHFSLFRLILFHELSGTPRGVRGRDVPTSVSIKAWENELLWAPGGGEGTWALRHPGGDW